MKLKIFLASIVLFLFSSCIKKDEHLSVLLATKMLINKTWYLDYSITANKTKSYLGQSTYFINFIENNNSITDSDGILGNYYITETEGGLTIQIIGKTVAGNSISYSYNVDMMGDKHMVLLYNANNIEIKQYYSTR